MPRKPKEGFQLTREEQIAAVESEIKTYEALITYEQANLRTAAEEVLRATHSIDELAEKLRKAQEELDDLII